MRTSPSMIQWHEGMFLSPQHFQQLQRRFESLCAGHMDLHHRYFHGVLTVSFDIIPIAAGTLRIQSIQAVMPDGLILNYPEEGGEAALQVDLMPFKEKALKSPLRVYVCVPEVLPSHSPVIGEWPRYSSVEGSIVGDENVRDNVIAIPRLVPKVSLIVSDIPPARYAALPVAELLYKDEGFVLTPYLPPSLWVTPEHIFHKRAITVAQRIREKSMFLSEKWQKQVGTTVLNETAGQLRPLLTILPQIEGFLQKQSVHPLDLYLFLLRVMGELSTMRLMQIPNVTPAYDHNDMRKSLSVIFETIESYIDSIEQSVIIIPFNKTERLFHLKLHASYLEGEVLVGFKAPTTMSEDALFDWIKDAVIACDSMVESTRVRRIIGAPRTPLDQEEMTDFLTGRGTLIFKLDVHSEFIKEGESLNIFNVADDETKRPDSIVLYLKKQAPDKAENKENMPG